MEYISFSEAMKKKFGCKVYKLSLQSGCTCPNRDGKISYGGCTFCSEGGSGEFAAELKDIDLQIEEAKALVNSKFSKNIKKEDRRYIAYFQSFTNTYGDPKRLKDLFMRAASHPEILAISVGTRPDCIDDDILKMLKSVNEKKELWVELGLQTIHDTSASRLNRGYDLKCFNDSYKRLKDAGIEVIVHLILGLPGESEDDMLSSVRYISNLKPMPNGVKLHLLHILKGSTMEKQYLKNPFPLPSLNEYSDLIVKCLRILPADLPIHRITGDGAKRLLVAPKWTGDKKRVLNTLNKCIREAKR